MKKKVFSLMMMCLFAITGAYAQFIEVGSGNGTNTSLPTNTNWKYSLTQQIYTVAELGGADTLTGIAFYNASSTAQTRVLDLYLKEDAKVKFDSTKDWVAVTAANKVFSGEVVFAANQWTVIPFDTPFAYTGTKNIVLTTDDNTGGYNGSTSFAVFDSTAMSLFKYRDNKDLDPIHPQDTTAATATTPAVITTYAGTIGNVKSQVRFTTTSNVFCADLPTNSYYKYNVTQQIFKPEQFGSVASVGSVKFFNQGAERTRMIDIYMTNTTKETFADGNDWEVVDTLDLVFSGEVTFASNAWTKIAFDTVFEYDGLGNVVLTMDDNTDVAYAGLDFYVLDSANMAIAYHSDDTSRFNPNPTDLTGIAGTLLGVRNDVEFGSAVYELTVHDGTETNGYIPMYGYYFDNANTKSECVFPATELAAMNGGQIQGVKFYPESLGSYGSGWSSTQKVFVKEVASAELTALSGMTDATVVFEGSLTLPVLGEPYEITFDAPYTYHGGNLLIGVYNTTAGGYKEVNWYGETVANSSLSGSYSYSQKNFLPKTTFVYEPGNVAPIVYDPNFYMLYADTDSTYAFADTLNFGDRPNNAWMRPVDVYALWNHTGRAVNVSRFDFTPEDGFFSAMAVDNELPFIMNVDDTIPMLFTTNITDTTFADTTFMRQFVTIYDARTAGVWPIMIHAYNPVEPDVFELARVVDTLPYADTLDVAAIPLYDNYRLPDTAHLDGPDAVYELTLDKDVLLNANVEGANGKVALYTQDFYEDQYGFAGPDMVNNYTGPAFGGNAGFEGDEFTEGFENGIPATWTQIDADGDGFIWELASDEFTGYTAHGGNDMVVSASYDNWYGYPLFPDNYLVSPQVTFGSTSTFSFWACGQDASWVAEHFGVAISTGSNTNPANFTTVAQWTATAREVGNPTATSRDGSRVMGAWHQYTVDLSPYVGQTGYIAIRHFNCTDMFYLDVDDVALSNSRTRAAHAYQAAPVIVDLPVPAGTYYLVASSTDPNFIVNIDTTAMPCPDMAECVYPADDADTIPVGAVQLKWKLDAYTTEYCVLFGRTYYCEDTLVPWTSDLAESAVALAQYHNTNYFWKVCQRNSSCTTGTDGEVWGFTTKLKWPTNLHAQDSSIFVGEDVVMEWNAIEDRTFRKYNIYLNDSLIGHTTETYIPGTYTTYTIPASLLTYNMTTGYRVNVTAVYDEGESPYSNTYILKVSGNGTLTGHVYEQDGTTGIADATVTINGQNEFGEPESYTATTNASGVYTITAHASKTGSYIAQAAKDGYQGPVDPIEGNPRPVVYNATRQANFIMDEVFYPLAEVIAEYYPDITSDDEYVKVYWSMNMMSQIVEDFETGDFSQYPWEVAATYPWTITTNNPYEGLYCMKSGGAGVASVTSTMQVTVNIPNDGIMSYFWKPSCENNYDKGHFFLDGVEKATCTGNGSWTEKEFPITGGDHTFKWTYTKDSSVNSYDDCVYVDYITFFRAPEPTPAGTVYDFENSTMQGWTTIDADGDGFTWMLASEVMGTGYGHNASNDCVLSQSYSNSYGPLTPDNYLVSPQVPLGGVITFYACAQDASYAAEHFGVAVSTTNNTSASAFTTIQQWTMTAKDGAKAPRGMNEQGTWYQFTVDLSAYSGNGYVAIRHFNCTDMFYLDVDDILIGDAKSLADNKPVRPYFNTNDRAFHHYRIYRTSCYNDGPYNSDNTVLLASDWPTDTVYIDTNFDTVSPGVYKWGVSRVYQGNRTDVYPDPNGRESEIVWSNCLDKDMWLEDEDLLDITVLLNSADSPEGVTVSFENLNPVEQELYPMDDVVLDWTGQYTWTEGFRKGNYQITVSNPGYETIVEERSIWDATSLRYVMIELLNPLDGLYVSRTGWAMWPEGLPTGNGGGGGGGGGQGGSGSLTVNDGTATNSYVPVYGFYCDAYLKCEYIIPAADLAQMNGKTINNMKFYLSSPASASWGSANFKVFMKEVSGTTLSAYTGYSDATVVYEGALDGTQPEMTVNFSTPYTYHGGNLLVGFYNTVTGTYKSCTFTGVDATGACVQGYSYTSLDAVSVNTRNFLPKTTFSWGREGDRHIEGYKVLCESIDHEPIFNENTIHNFCQVATDQLVEGGHYICKVAIIYSTGQSDWTEVEWEYEPCEHYADIDVTGEPSAEGNLLSWGDVPGPGPQPGQGDEFYENFDAGMPAGWTAIDANNDGYNWVAGSQVGGIYLVSGASLAGSGHNSSADMMCSGSYSNATGAAITPDNYLVTPQVTLVNGSTFSFYACAQDASYAAEHFGVFVSDNGTSDWTEVQSWTMTAKEGLKAGRGMNAQGNWYEKTVDLSAFAGQKYIAIRHFNCNDQFILNVDDATLAVGAKGNRAPWDLMMTFTAPEGGHYGVAYDGVNFYTSNWGYSGAAHNFYKYDLSGNMIEGFEIPNCGTLRGMTYDGTYFYGVANSSTVYCVDLANHALVNTFTSAYGAMRGITYDPVRNGFWVIGNWSGNLTLIDQTGAIVQTGPAPTSASDLAYYEDADGVEHIYCFNNGTCAVEDWVIGNATMGGSVFDFTTVPGYASGSSGGCTVGSFNGKIAFMGDIQQSPNLIGVYELRDDDTPGPGPTPTPLEGVLGYMIFRDGEWVAELPNTATGYLDEGEFGDHDYLVRVIYDGEAVLPSGNYYYAMSCGTEVYVEGELVCDPSDPINGVYFYDEGTFGALISWGTQVEPINEWLYYDNGTYDDAIGTGGSDVYWGIMIPSNMLAAYDGTFLTKVALYEDADQNTEPITLNIYYGGTNAPATLVHTQNVTPVAADDFHEIALSSALPIDVTQNLWITVKEYGAYPATGCENLNDPNGRWISLDGIDWADVNSYGLNYTWLIRGFVTNEAKGIVSELNPIEFVGGGNGNVADLGRRFGEDAHKTINANLTDAVRSDIIAYNIYRSTDNVIYDLIATVPAGLEYYEYFDEVAAGNYYYQVTTVYENGCESYPAPYINNPNYDYVLVEVTGIDDNNSHFALYPNPTNGNVKIEANGMRHITVVSVLGQVVYDTDVTADEYQINMAQFSAGVYMVRVATETGVMTQRVTVVK